MPTRSPITGQFIDPNTVRDLLQMDDARLEYQNWYYNIRSDGGFDGGSGNNYGESQGFEGLEVIDFEKELDRDEVAMLLQATTYVASDILGATADASSHAFACELSASERLEAAPHLNATESSGVDSTFVADGTQDGTATESFIIDVAETRTDTADLVHRPLRTAHAGAQQDQGNSLGTGPTNSADVAAGPIDPFDWLLDDRDELFLNGTMMTNQLQDSDNSVPHNHVTGQLAYVTMEENRALEILGK